MVKSAATTRNNVISVTYCPRAYSDNNNSSLSAPGSGFCVLRARCQATAGRRGTPGVPGARRNRHYIINGLTKYIYTYIYVEKKEKSTPRAETVGRTTSTRWRGKIIFYYPRYCVQDTRCAVFFFFFCFQFFRFFFRCYTIAPYLLRCGGYYIDVRPTAAIR